MQYVIFLFHSYRTCVRTLTCTHSSLHFFALGNSLRRKHPLSHSYSCETIEKGKHNKSRDSKHDVVAAKHGHAYFAIVPTVLLFCHSHYIVGPHGSILPLQLVIMHREKNNEITAEYSKAIHYSRILSA